MGIKLENLSGNQSVFYRTFADTRELRCLRQKSECRWLCASNLSFRFNSQKSKAASSEIIVKVKEPQQSEWTQLREDQILFTYLHLAPDPDQAIGLMVHRDRLRDRDRRARRPLRTKVAEIGPDQVAAFICEPIQGSGGVIVPSDGYLTAMREACRDLGILFIADEVITGFGRTGPLFACESESVAPDLVTVAKGLTSGYVPIGAVFLSDILYARIRDVMADGAPFGHGLTYSGHPVAAAVGLEVLRLYQEGGLLRNGAAVGDYLQTRLRSFADHPLVGDVRGRGLLAALELVQNKTSKERFAPEVLQIGRRLAVAANSHQLIFRAFSDGVIGLAPALCILREEVDELVVRLGRGLDDVWADLGHGPTSDTRTKPKS
jgi:adenosylmethionine-8-amino-7-oxononanoate aminotransferase